MAIRYKHLIAAAMTPMHEDGSLDLDRVSTLVDHLVADGATGIFAVGSTGESSSLTVAERMELAEAFADAARGRLRLIVHVGHTSAREAAGLAAHAQKIGADGIAAVPPFYFKPDSIDTLIDCAAEVAAGAPDLPYFYYHIPMLTGVDFDPPSIMHAAAKRIGNFAGMKYTSPVLQGFHACIDQAEGRYEMFFGVDEMLMAAIQVGADGSVGSTYNFASPLYRRMLDAIQAGDLDEALRRQSQAVSMCRVFRKYRNLAGAKAMMKLIDMDCGPSRVPLKSLSDEELASLRRELEEIGYFEFARPAATA